MSYTKAELKDFVLELIETNEFYGNYKNWEQNDDYPEEASFLSECDLGELKVDVLALNNNGHEFEKIGGKRAREISSLPIYQEVKEELEKRRGK